MTDESANLYDKSGAIRALGDLYVIRDNGRFADLHPCGEPNQYAVVTDESGCYLRTIPREKWIASPRIMDVNTRTGYCNRVEGQ